MFRESGDSRYVCGNLLEDCFQHDFMYVNKDLQERTYDDKVVENREREKQTTKKLFKIKALA